MRTNYLCHVENMIDIQWSRHVVGGGGGEVGTAPLALNLRRTKKVY